MADDVQVVLVPKLEQVLHKMPEVSTNTKDLAEAIATQARSTAPVLTGSYRDQIRVEKSNKSNSGIWRVFSGSKKSAWIEFGIPNQGRPGLFVLRNAAQAVGAKFIKGKR